jgi:hypothetical protein
VPADLGRRLGSGVDRELRPGVRWRPCAPAAGDWLLVALLVLSTAVPPGRYLALATVRTCRYLVGDFLTAASAVTRCRALAVAVEADRCRAVDHEEVPVDTDGHA